MAKLTTKTRNKLKGSTFGLPGERKYPMPDRSHAANAKARATQQVAKGNLTLSEKKKIDRKANKILGENTMKSQTKKDREDETKPSIDERKAMKKRLSRTKNKTTTKGRNDNNIRDYMSKM